MCVGLSWKWAPDSLALGTIGRSCGVRKKKQQPNRHAEENGSRGCGPTKTSNSHKVLQPSMLDLLENAFGSVSQRSLTLVTLSPSS